jgi:hypothetical protein
MKRANYKLQILKEHEAQFDRGFIHPQFEIRNSKI